MGLPISRSRPSPVTARRQDRHKLLRVPSFRVKAPYHPDDPHARHLVRDGPSGHVRRCPSRGRGRMLVRQSGTAGPIDRSGRAGRIVHLAAKGALRGA